jgi:squalene-hopene/tetraprenyl-beta-curcumene cyclase
VLFKRRVSGMIVCFAVVFLTTCADRSPKVATWNPKSAAAYLDEREVTWRQWPVAARDHDTFCVSCHTVVPYILCRPTLRDSLAEGNSSDPEQRILENVERRVRLWDVIEPYYGDAGLGYGQASDSRGTESVLNAFILVASDLNNGHLRQITRIALKQMWDLQLSEGPDIGSWRWINHGMEPWEASDSQFYGAALAAVAIGMAPDSYRFSPDIQMKLTLLQGYLNRKYKQQSLMNRVVLLWASTKISGLIDYRHQQLIIHEILKKQQADGGWELSSNVWPESLSMHSIIRMYLRSDWTGQDSSSDGYATGLITFVLEEVGTPPQNEHLKLALSWLENNQNPSDGSWPSVSVSQQRNKSSNIGHFMRDAATAYAVLALTDRGRTSKAPNQEIPMQGSSDNSTSGSAKRPERPRSM